MYFIFKRVLNMFIINKKRIKINYIIKININFHLKNFFVFNMHDQSANRSQKNLTLRRVFVE